MKILNASRIGVAQGQVDLFSDFEQGGEMWTGEGDRERRQRVAFGEPYLNAPTVHVSLALWDMDSGHHMRADITAENVSEAGFDMVFRTWSDSRVARVRAAWIAIGELTDDEVWDVE